jgi:hypothetical protein
MNRAFIMGFIIAILAGGLACSDNSLHKQPQPKYPAIEVDPLSIDYGALEAGQSLTFPITIRSVGPVDLDIIDLVMAGDDNFELIADETEFTLAPEEETSVSVIYTATGGSEKHGTLSVMNMDPDNGEVIVDLHGSGLAPAILIDPPVWDFGDHLIGCEEEIEVKIKSVGTYMLNIYDYSFMASPSVTAMSIFTDELFDGIQLAPGEEVSVWITFVPEDLATYDGLLTVTSDDPDQETAEGTQVGAGIPEDWYNDHFLQEGNNWTDILWVVDNSCSMSEEQSTLGDDFSAFHGIINSAGVDYRIATVTTDNAQFQGTTKVIDANTPNGAATFAANCSLGTNGSGTERGLKFGWDALTMAVNGTPPNTGFYRDDAGLRVVFVSDEPDQSGSWSTYLTNYQSLKSNPAHVILSGIVGTNGTTATSCNGAGGNASAGTGYVDIVNATGGILGSICDGSWSQTLTQLGWLSLSLADTFPLSHEAVPSTIEVKLNGVDVFNGWVYDPNVDVNGAVIFEPNYVPEDGDTVDISYGTPGSCEG